MRLPAFILALAAATVAGIPVAHANVHGAYRPVRVPGAWGPATASAKAIDAWQKKEFARTRPALAGVNSETARLALRLQRMYIAEAAAAMRRNPNWATTEPWLAARQPFPAVCTAGPAELTAIFAIASVGGKPVPVRDIKAVRQLSHPAPGIACSYDVADTRAHGDDAVVTFTFVFVPDASGLLIGNVLAKVNRATP